MKIFLDDERYPPDIGDNFLIVRSYDLFKSELDDLVYFGDKLSFISWDHDLGEDKTGLDCAKLLVRYDMDHGILSNDFSYYVHSQNPVGKANIESYLTSYFKFKDT